MKPDTTVGDAVRDEALIQQAEILAQLQKLNTNVERQLSLKQMLLYGVIHGLSFAVGSTILFSVLAQTIFSSV